ncbi:hypothetical protein CK203_004086 [Vitis vinifera]|uniref:Retrotransposon gag domain-containing protein n=1 Tax=Vitis vinifera TaxID=29760 RepID=A0A438K9D4_VITVI|nr:hypothetical protein CK203_004086 [Vitis vinifera]
MPLVCVGRTSIPLSPLSSLGHFLHSGSRFCKCEALCVCCTLTEIECMCGCNVHLAWKRPVSSEACRGLRTAEARVEVDSRIYVYRWSTDLVIVFLIATSGPCACMLYCHLLEFYLVSFIHFVCIVGSQFRSRLSLESHSWRRVGGRLIRADSYPSSDSSVEMSDELASTLASIQEFMAGVSRRLDQIESSRQDPHPAGMVTDETIPHASQTAQTRPPGVSLGTPFHLADHYETIPPPTVTVPPPMVPTIEDTRLAEQEAKVERLESMMRQIRLQDGGLTWDDRDGIPAASLPAKFRMPDIELGGPFPMSLSGAAQRRELEATRQRPEESISSFVTRWRAKVAGMVDRPKEQDQIDMVLRNLQPRFARRLVGIPFQDLRSLVQAAFSVEEAIARGLWTDTTPSPDSKGKKLIGPFSRSGEVGAISYQHRRPAHHSAYSLLQSELFPSSQYQYQPDYAQEPYIAQTSMQPRPPHPRAATHPPPRPYAQRPARQFTPLGMTLTRAFEKLRDAGVIVPLAPRPLPHPIPPHFRSHEHCLYHQIPGHDTERCSALHHAIQDLIDSGVVDLARPSVTTNPLPTHSTHAVEDLVQSAWVHHLVAVHSEHFSF